MKRGALCRRGQRAKYSLLPSSAGANWSANGGGDNDQALIHGQYYVSEATGSLGTAIRGKAPIWDEEGNIIGLVSVGFMMDRVAMDVARYNSFGWMLVALMICLGFAGAYWLSQHLKRSF